MCIIAARSNTRRYKRISSSSKGRIKKMLNRAKVMKELQTHSTDLFIDRSHEYNLARACWQRIVADIHFIDKVHALPTPWLIPSWQGAVDRTVSIMPLKSPYRVVAIDGSQIYPD